MKRNGVSFAVAGLPERSNIQNNLLPPSGLRKEICTFFLVRIMEAAGENDKGAKTGTENNVTSRIPR